MQLWQPINGAAVAGRASGSRGDVWTPDGVESPGGAGVWRRGGFLLGLGVKVRQ